MVLSICEQCLICSAAVIVIADILLALCLRTVLPDYLTQDGFYPADNRKVNFYDAVQMCPCLARVYPSGTKDHITFTMLKDNVRRKKRQIINETSLLGLYPFIVSLSIPAYIDDTKDKIFACNGLIQSGDTLITTKSCVKDEMEWHNLTVRSESTFWSEFGNEHSVVNVSFLAGRDLVFLTVSPEFPKRIVPNSKITHPFRGEWVHAVSLGWDDYIYRKKSAFRYKFQPFEVDEWTSRTCDSKSSKVCGQWENCRMSSKPLVTSCHVLIGMKMGVGAKCNGFSNLNAVNKDCYKIYGDSCKSTETDIC